MVDPYADEPLRDQAAAIIRAQIESGELGHHDWLPSETTLSQELGASRDTVRRALAMLKHEGLVESRKGRGWFVR
jgi:DNA-binding GntR family transcriptional regulator